MIRLPINGCTSLMPTARHHVASAVVGGNIYVIGGRLTGSLVNVDANKKYDPVSNQWITDLKPAPSKRSSIAATSVNGSIYVLEDIPIKERLIIMNGIIRQLILGAKKCHCPLLDMD